MNNTALISWVVSHLNFIGWPLVFAVIYKLFIFLFHAGRAFTRIEQRVLDGEDTINKMATNHLPHIEAAITDMHPILIGIRDELKGMREDLKELRK